MLKNKLYKNKIEIIQNFIRDKKVLDIGCADSGRNYKNLVYSPNFTTTDSLTKYSRSYLGIDMDKKSLKKMSKLGYNVDYCNILSRKDIKRIIETHGKFDIIVAGDIIEHVEDIPKFIQNCHLLLKSGGGN